MQPMTHRFTPELRRLERASHNYCSSCGRDFSFGETSHSGYDAEGNPIYVGECCAWRLKETAARNLWIDPTGLVNESAPANASLWRYMDLAKFAALMRDRSLYFPRADHLGDSWEGAMGATANKARWERYQLSAFSHAIRNTDKSDEEVEAEAKRLVLQLEASAKAQLQSTYVSCWHENESESEALWRLYCPPPTAGVAVRTTFGDLEGVFSDDPSVSIGRVKYIDFRTEFVRVDEAIFRKRQTLSHEQEVRAVIYKYERQEDVGLNRQIKLSVLIKEVVVSPFSPAWLESILSDLMRRYDVQLPIRASELLIQPFF
jgi:hypothetical protein